MADALDILLGHVEVQRRTVEVDGELISEARVVAYDRYGMQSIYAGWSVPVQGISHSVDLP